MPDDATPATPAGRWVSTEEAARVLNLSPRTIRRHIDAGKLRGERADDSHAFRVWLDGEEEPAPDAAGETPPDAAEQGSDTAIPAIPGDALTWVLADHLADLTRQNQELTQRIEALASEAATYKERLRIFEEQAKALPAGEPAPVWRPWWKRLLGVE